jgi:hypothetical protein
MASREVFHFDEFTLEVQERRLLRDDAVDPASFHHNFCC